MMKLLILMDKLEKKVEIENSSLSANIKNNNFSDRENALINLKFEEIKQLRNLEIQIYFTRLSILIGIGYFLISKYWSDITLINGKILASILLFSIYFFMLSQRFLFDDSKHELNSLFELLKKDKRKIEDYKIVKLKFSENLINSIMGGLVIFFAVLLFSSSMKISVLIALSWIFVLVTSERIYAERFSKQKIIEHVEKKIKNSKFINDLWNIKKKN